ncbi:MAG: multifunctional CCA addition/repair protein [Methylococcales symbiont of Iophon sp. n. MRB-2018]|nr:MAG: multifunctional CCA addition/repair protein [Methylococcales symbiont of Iophon sp. n. MRB-2018]KAF3978911.1 MAG: multifunctional CCA addition/repair protein [Methylococcales symbiont of Iophon sp. n. MRB-2018]
MKTFLVGGAVRDTLLNISTTDKDWVVVGETAESMIKLGFQAVGKDFPVFLHPHSHEEYALARTERKTAPGYKGFSVHASPEVTLEQDLARRDLTINAIAQDEDGHIIDPYHGQKDLENRIFRHVSPAFSEDPVRILRIARFAARFSHLGFTIAKETMQLMKQMVVQGETDHLVAERIWSELEKALSEKTPSAFFYTLKECNALATIFPEIEQLFGVPQPEKHHPEIDTGVHSLMCLEQATKLSPSSEVRLAALLHDLGKAATDPNKWPSHHGHEELGLAILDRFCVRLRIPKKFKTLAQHVMRYHTHCHRVFELRPATLTDMLGNIGAFKSPDTIKPFMLACEADAKGRTGFENRDYPQSSYLLKAAKAAYGIDSSEVLNSDLQGSKIGKAIRLLRIKAISKLIKSV